MNLAKKNNNKNSSILNSVQTKLYDHSFHIESVDGATYAAEAVLPWLLDIIKPASVVDYGCGVGAWLAVCKKNGIKKVHGFDGGYINLSDLLIKKSEYTEVDLNTFSSSASPKYDLAISLETGEHLKPSSADRFVKMIATSSHAVLFSTAIPRQGGIYHLNEQWPDYWIAKFAKYDFVAVNIRSRFLNDENIPWWYRQNMFLFLKKNDMKGLEQFIYNPDFVLINKKVFKRYDNLPSYISHKIHVFLQHIGFIG